MYGILESKVYSNGGEIGFLESLIGESAKKGGFADGAIAYENYFEEIVVLFDHLDRELI